MKTNIILIILILAGLTAFGQDISLPQSECRLVLKNGKAVKNVRLWRLDSIKLEYVKGGNLDEILVTALQYIETPANLLKFNENGHMLSQRYDWLIMQTGDTISGIIDAFSVSTISMRRQFSDKTKLYWKTDMKKIILATDDLNATLNAKPRPAAQIQEPNPGKAITTTFVTDSVIPMRSDNDTITSPKDTLADYYHESYQAGERDADKIKFGGWGAGAFWLGLFYGSPFVTSAALSSKVGPVNAPKGVDPKLYNEGYKNKYVHKRTQSAAKGASAAKAIVGVFLIILIAVGAAG